LGGIARSAREFAQSKYLSTYAQFDHRIVCPHDDAGAKSRERVASARGRRARATGAKSRHARCIGPLRRLEQGAMTSEGPEKETNMAGAILLQDWITVRGNTTGTIVRQQEDDYVDLAPFQDFVAYIEVSDTSGTPLMQFETSPTKDDNLFVNMDAAAFTPTVGVMTPRIYRYSSANVPLARFVRWKVPSASPGAGVWSLTFRIWLSPNLS
jgi:hypothetical protein